MIRDRLKVVHSRKKSYVDTKRKEVVYEKSETEHIFVCHLCEELNDLELRES